MFNSTSGFLKDSASKVEFRLMALLGQLACESTQKLQSLVYCVISVYVISAHVLSLVLRILMLRPYYILTDRPPPGAGTGALLADAVRLVRVEDGHVVRVGRTGSDVENTTDARRSEAGEVGGAESGTANGGRPQRNGGEVRFDVMSGCLVKKVGSEDDQVAIARSQYRRLHHVRQLQLRLLSSNPRQIHFFAQQNCVIKQKTTTTTTTKTTDNRRVSYQTLKCSYNSHVHNFILFNHSLFSCIIPKACHNQENKFRRQAS